MIDCVKEYLEILLLALKVIAELVRFIKDCVKREGDRKTQKPIFTLPQSLVSRMKIKWGEDYV